MPQSVRDYFEREWNRRMGVPTRRPIQVQAPEQVSFNQRVAPRVVQQQVSAGTVDLGTDVENAYEEYFGERAIGGAGSPTEGGRRSLVRSGRETIDRINKEQQKLYDAEVKKQKEIQKAYENERARLLAAVENEKGDDLPWWKDAINSVVNSPVGGALDIISRPAYGVFEGAREWIESTEEEGSGSDWKPALLDAVTALDDATHGIALGVMGKKKTGFGQVVEEAVPNAPHPAKVALGLYGEIALDPLTLMTGGTAAISRKTGRQLSRLEARQFAETAAKKAIDNSLDVGRRAINDPTTGRFVKPSVALSNATSRTAAEIADQAMLTARAGSKTGSVKLGGKLNYADTVSQNAANTYRSTLLRQFETNYERFMNHTKRYMKDGKGTLSPGQIKRLADNDPYFKQMIDEIKVGELNPSAVQRAGQTVRDGLNDEVEAFANRVFDDLADFSYNAPAMRVAHKTIPFTKIGKAWDQNVGKVFSKNQRFQNMMKAISYEKLFPGRLSLISQRVKSIGVQNFDLFRTTVRDVAKGVSAPDAKRIQYAIEQNIDLPNQRLNDLKNWVKNQYHQIWEDEVKAGIRSADAVRIENYTYVWNRGGSKRAINDFKTQRKSQIGRDGTARGYTTADAKAQNLRPVENAFEALLRRKMKSSRDLTKSWFLHDLLDHYGFAGAKLSPDAVTRRGLKRINKKVLNEQLRTALKENEEWYLPGEMYDVFRNYQDIAKFNDNGALVRALRTVTTKYKALVTLPFPGYHIRNMIGDLYMGLLDGVKTRTYGEILRKSVGKNGILEPLPNSTYVIGPGWTLSGDGLWDLYRRSAGSGSFYRTDLGDTYNWSWATQKLRDASQKREDFGRIAHFLHALREEYLPRGKKLDNVTRARETAVESAVYRVNHFKFDYGALTKGEQQYAKLAMPFYTFSRKAIPTLVESLFLAPKWLSRPNRFMEYRDGSGAENFQDYLVPKWMQDIGYATLTDESEPWVITGDVLPTNAMQNVPTGEGGAKGFASTFMSQMNPFITALPELAAGETFFSGRETGSLPNYILNKIPQYTAGQQVLSDKDWKEKLLGTRAGLGVGVRQVTEGQQEFRLRELEDELIDLPFREFNYGEGADAGVRIYVSRRKDGETYRVKKVGSKEVLLDTMDKNEALEFAKQLVKFVKAKKD